MKFTLRQKEAIAAVIAELCNAETVTGVRKMQCLNALLGEVYGITNRTVLQAQTLTLEKAVDRIGDLDPDVRTRLLQDLEAIARADGSYSPEEGVLLEGLKAALVPQEGKTSVDCRIFSVRADRLKFDGRKATFIHPDKQLCDEDLRERIRNMSDKIFRHLDELVLLFYCFGYDFVFIPQLRKDFGTDPDLIRELEQFSFFFSHVPREYVESAIASFGHRDESRKFTTSRFSEMLFSGREDDVAADHDTTAFLIKLSDSMVTTDSKDSGSVQVKYYNFLYLPVVGDGISSIIGTVKEFFQGYTDAVGASGYVVRPQPTGRLRHFDLYQSLIARLAGERVRKFNPALVIDPDNGTLTFLKALSGEDVTVSFKASIADYLFVLWWSVYEDDIRQFEEMQGEINEVRLLRRIRERYRGDKEVDYPNNKRKTDDEIAEGFRRLRINVKYALKNNGLLGVIERVEYYLPAHVGKDQDIRAYRIAFRDIRIAETDADGRRRLYLLSGPEEQVAPVFLWMGQVLEECMRYQFNKM
ncbi:MAG: hypothetical protein IJ255_06880 [Bacteroidales bacterium]|nr:hypothetical protein [Bacteroidales bacterium]